MNKFFNRYKRIVILFTFLLMIGSIVSVFGNACSDLQPSKFEVRTTSADELSSTGQASTVASEKISNDDYLYCFENAATPNNIPNCLSLRTTISSSLLESLSSALELCAAEVGHPILLALCLNSRAVTVRSYRFPLQLDIDRCVSAVGEEKLAGCLDKNGILPSNVTQNDLNSCLAAVGPLRVERCLRNRSLIPRRMVLTQFDVNLCLKIGGTAKIYDCLNAGELIPLVNDQPQFLSADVDSCITAATSANLVKCLRKNVKISRILLSEHINRCIELVGIQKLGVCLNANGILPDILGVLLTQEQLNECVTARGIESLIMCLRLDLGTLNKTLTQADINECSRIYGPSNIADCLNTNDILPVGVTQTTIDTCITAIAASATPGGTIVKCLRKNGFISKTLMQADVNNCIKLVDISRTATCLNANVASFAPLVQADIDSCKTLVGESNLAKCLKNRNLIPKFLSQEHIKACDALVGPSMIAGCLDKNGFIDLNAPVPITQQLINTCIANVGLPNVRKCLVNNNALSSTIDADATAACTLFAGATNLAACYTANGLQ